MYSDSQVLAADRVLVDSNQKQKQTLLLDWRVCILTTKQLKLTVLNPVIFFHVFTTVSFLEIDFLKSLLILFQNEIYSIKIKIKFVNKTYIQQWK